MSVDVSSFGEFVFGLENKPSVVQIHGKVLDGMRAAREIEPQEDRVGFEAADDPCSLVFFKFGFGVPIVDVHLEGRLRRREIFREVNLPTGPDDFFVADV